MKKQEVEITTIIGRGAECNGDFNAEGSIRVDGVVEGDVTVTGTLIVGVAGCINGDINAKVIIVGGEVIGNLNAPEKIELTSTARVLGDIVTTTIIIDERAVFQGNCNMNQDVTGKRPRPSSRVLKAGKKSAKAAIAEALKEVEEADQEETGAKAPASEEAGKEADQH